MPRTNIEELEGKLSKLNKEQSRVEDNASRYENALIAKESDPRLVLLLRDSFSGLREIAFERGRLMAQLDDLRSEQRLAANAPEEILQDKTQPDNDDWYLKGRGSGDKQTESTTDRDKRYDELFAALDAKEVEQQPRAEKIEERALAGNESEWWETNSQQRAAAEQKYQDWVKSRDDPDHVDDLDDPTPTRPR